MNIFHNTDNIYPIRSSASSNIYQEEIHAFKSLWKAVITQALMDASSNSKKKFAKKQKIEALIGYLMKGIIVILRGYAALQIWSIRKY